MMKPMPGLEKLLQRAKGLGVFGTKERSVINGANRHGIASIVAQQIEVGRQVLAAGLVPILEPEVNIKSADRAESDSILLDELANGLSTMPGTDKVMLKLSLPVKPGLFDPLVDHPRVLCVVALSGGYSRPEACMELARNRGVVASFSRALLEDLRFQMSDTEFNAALASAIDDIYKASTQKVAAVS
jgi:fructose-bisphosphate aldolase class I